MRNLILYTFLLTYSVVSFGESKLYSEVEITNYMSVDNNDKSSTKAKGFTNDRMNLDEPTADKFPITDLVWPVNVGDANVCLWNDDKIAATTITIDDNIEGDHAWWLSMQTKYDLDFTWFIIINSVTDWNKYQALVDAGHDVQAHDLAIDYGHGAINDSSDAKYIEDITKVRDTIEEKLTNQKCLTFAYPYGTNKSSIIRDKYIAMRGVWGVMNYANKTNYLCLTFFYLHVITHELFVGIYI